MNLKEWIKSKRSLDKKIIEKRAHVADTVLVAMAEDRYSFFEFDFSRDLLKRMERLNDYGKYEFFYNLMAGWDEVCNFDRETGEYLNSLFADPNYVTAIHRAYLGPVRDIDGVPSNENIKSIVEDGLINNGHGMQGVFDDIPSLSLTTTPMTSFGDLINLVGSYKDNNVTVILQFPTEEVDVDLSFKGKDVYINNGGVSYIDPKYIKGVVIKQEGSRDKYYSKEELLGTKQMEMGK
ncbi:MAG: hypothetical protein IKP07_02210 [Bacilli bacterium]|nr:hypothetical protein [Bacilli bacterium]